MTAAAAEDWTHREAVVNGVRLHYVEAGAGRLGVVKIEGDNILLGKPFTFNKDNIDQFDF